MLIGATFSDNTRFRRSCFEKSGTNVTYVGKKLIAKIVYKCRIRAMEGGILLGLRVTNETAGAVSSSSSSQELIYSLCHCGVATSAILRQRSTFPALYITSSGLHAGSKYACSLAWLVYIAGLLAYTDNPQSVQPKDN